MQSDIGASGSLTRVAPVNRICKTCGHDKGEHLYDDACLAWIAVNSKAERCRCRKFEVNVKPKARAASGGI
jgi:hypothetical protein